MPKAYIVAIGIHACQWHTYSCACPNYMDRKLILAAQPTRPEVGVQPAFEFGDGVQVRPGAAAKNGVDRGVVDVCIAGGGADAAVANGGAKVLCQLAGHLRRGIYGRHAGPAVHELPRMEPGRSGHKSSVDDRARARA